MRVVHLSAVDLNLLPLLDALLAERHVTRAARRVGLSQPAASRGLGRLRELLDDPLLVRSGRQLQLTPRAEGLREPVRLALGLIGGALEPAATFEPARARRTVRLACDDYSAFVLLTPLLERLARVAPGVDLQVLPAGGDGLDRLTRGEVDGAFGPIVTAGRLPPGVHAEALVDDRLVGMVARGHPFARRAPTLERYLAARHALTAPVGRRGGFVDDALAARGRERRVAVSLPHFLAMPFVVTSTDLVLTLPERVATAYASLLPVALFAPPLPLPGFTTGFFWHQRDVHDPALAWFRRETLALGASLSAPGSPARRRRARPPARRPPPRPRARTA